MFGEGIYFADVASKAGLHCHATAAQPFGFLVLARVALGKELYVTKPDIALENCAYKADGYFVLIIFCRVSYDSLRVLNEVEVLPNHHSVCQI